MKRIKQIIKDPKNREAFFIGTTLGLLGVFVTSVHLYNKQIRGLDIMEVDVKAYDNDSVWIHGLKFRNGTEQWMRLNEVELNKAA